MPNVSDVQMGVWLNHFTKDKVLWPRGVTKQRLSKYHAALLSNTRLRQDVLVRHNGLKYDPEFMAVHMPTAYRHAVGNMGAIIREIIQEQLHA